MTDSDIDKDRWRVVIVAVPSCMASAVIGTQEAFAIADLARAGQAPRIEVEIATVGGDASPGFAGFAVPSSVQLDAVERPDAVIVPPVIGDPNGFVTEQRALVDWLAGAGSDGSITAAACTGTFLLAETGMLNGRRATTTPHFRTTFEKRYPEVHLRTALRVVDEGAVVTAGATTSYLDLALALIGRFHGPRLAVEVARILATDPNPRSQRPYMLPAPAPEHSDREIQRTEQWMAQNLVQPLDSESLAGVAGMSRRNFLRRFRAATGETPREYLQRLRVEAAMKDLEATNLSIEEVTYQCGYEDSRSFRRLFRRQTGLTPGEYRRRFGYGGAGQEPPGDDD